MHPIRRTTPDPSHYTRSEEVQCLRIGCFASRNKSNRGHLLPTHPSGSIRRCQTTSKYPPGSEQEALHPLRRDTPVTSRYTRSEGVQCLRIGCTTSSTTSMIADNLAGVGHADIQRAQVEQRCTRYSSNALDRKALHCLLSSATLR